MRKAIIICDLDFNIENWTDETEQIYGWSESEVQGQYLGNFLTSNLPDEQKEQLKTTGHCQLDTEQPNRHGQILKIHSEVTKIKRGGGDKYLVINTDITEEFTSRQFASFLVREASEFGFPLTSL